jgi:hypothetical protein
MPVSRLLVEGKLEIEIFGSLFAGKPTVDPTPNPKSSLAPRVRDLRRGPQRVEACFVRDRDFDHLPPIRFDEPVVDTADSGITLGWRWCRHEVENYLIEPLLVHEALGWDRAMFEAELVLAAQSIKHYQAARWTVGLARKVLPPQREFPTRPDECDRDFLLPSDLSQAGTAQWVHDQASSFMAKVTGLLSKAALDIELAVHSARLSDAFLADVPNVLVWCSGKDLLGALTPWLNSNRHLHPTEFCHRLRDWIKSHPDRTFELLPEWNSFRELLYV